MRGRAMGLLGVFALAATLGALLFVLTEPDVQLAGAEELVRRRSDAVAYFTFDNVFVVIYAAAGPAALVRFGRALERRPSWIVPAAVALAAAGTIDVTENTLLLMASSNGDPTLVRIGHLLAIPKYALALIGLVLGVRACLEAARVLRRR